MQNDVKQVYYFHADANSIGGFLGDPPRPVSTPCSVSLSATGGSTTTTARQFAFEDSVKASAAYTHASGVPTRMNGPWVQHVVSVVENFSLLGKITAEKIIAHIAIEQPAAGGGPRKISFAGSQFVNLRINDQPVSISLDPALLPVQRSNIDVSKIDAYNHDASLAPVIAWPTLTAHANSEGARYSTSGIPAWAQTRLGWIGKPRQAANANGGYTLCSLVNQVGNVKGGPTFAHCIELPDIGRIFLGEVTVLPYAAHLTMLRAELGCKVTGQVSCCMVVTNGTSMPPSD